MYFTHFYGYFIRVWNNGNIYEFKVIYGRKILTKDYTQSIERHLPQQI
ncbi:hypothetical protein [Acholeplasma granularum]|nr:hypothetical protein [Acholeplasma granularum]